MVVTQEQCLEVLQAAKKSVAKDPNNVTASVIVSMFALLEEYQQKLAAANHKIELLESIEQDVLVSPDVSAYVASMDKKEGV